MLGMRSVPYDRAIVPYTASMPTINITRKHALSHKKAKAVAEKIAKDLHRRFGLHYAWNGDHIEFSRTGVQGSMSVGKDRITLDAQLGWLLTPLKPSIEQAIVAELDRLSTKA
jgi:putative polyhydroxyalkanoate system protein